eukprot:TRINITY_DN10335_c0_g3_i1.p1 TRINITY_DN10335_c0_g3~~TRINITY_DN10335_c0_g3_i1.p1  ORF type:complete len:802 (+),score=117.22 TRINITY_DN10335_c0_g3_i1:327-2408(+)
MRERETQVDIKFEDLSLELFNGCNVLEGVTGQFGKARMCAIMGPSGAGKTTFMNVLCGKANYGRAGGKIWVNGQEVDMASIKRIMGFVPQDDIVHEELTVREQIRFSAELRNEVGTPKSRIQKITNDVLHVMQIDHIMNSIVGGVENRGISGGQRKRVNIGLELAAQPSVLFLDEPTSGLDATSSLTVVLSLKKMCQLGMSSIMVIHQPRYSLFTLFDDVILLGKGGRTVYLGPSASAKSYFESVGFRMPADENPSDWFMDIISGEVENKSVSNFNPPMLFDMWNQFGGGIQQGSQAGRTLNEEEDKHVLAAKLGEEWSKIDQNHDGVLDRQELADLLRLCTNSVPEKQVVNEIFDAMTGGEGEHVTKEQFQSYLTSLRGDVARSDSRFLTITVDSSDSGSDSDQQLVEGRLLSRKTPGSFGQFLTLMHRMGIQWWRKNSQRALFIAAIVLAAVVLGVLDHVVIGNPPWDAMTYLNTHTALGLLIGIYCLGVFGRDRAVFWRECSSGLSITGHFFSRVIMNLADLLLMTGMFTTIYYMIETRNVHFGHYLFPYLMVTFVASGWGYLVSTIVPPQHGPFLVSLIMFVVCGLLGNPQSLNSYLTGGIMNLTVNAISVTRWSVMMSFNYYAESVRPQPKGNMQISVYCMEKDAFSKHPEIGSDYMMTGFAFLLAQALVLHFLAYLALRFVNRSKMV